MAISAMQLGLSKAVKDLRVRIQWNQKDLAKEMCKVAARIGYDIRPNRVCVSRWENGDAAPSEPHRAVLAHIAARDERTEHLAHLFRAPVSAWRLAGYIQSGNGDEQNKEHDNDQQNGNT